MREAELPAGCCSPDAEMRLVSVHVALQEHLSPPCKRQTHNPMQCRQVAEEPATNRRRGKKMSSPERWEVTQLIKSGVLDVTEYPDFDDENGQVRGCYK